MIRDYVHFLIKIRNNKMKHFRDCMDRGYKVLRIINNFKQKIKGDKMLSAILNKMNCYTIGLFLFVAISELAISGNLKSQLILNSSASEDRPLITADGKKMYFNSSKQRYVYQDIYGYDYYEKYYRYDYDIYYSVKEGDGWSEPENLGNSINSDKDDGVVSISPDGQTIYFVSFKTGWIYDGGPFYKAELHGDNWTNIQGLGGGINDFFFYNDYIEYETQDEIIRTKYISGASISPDGKEFYFSTDVNRIYGQMDIWISKLIDGNWSTPINLGPIINAHGAENTEPFISLDNKTLFYSTNGLGGYGGKDIFYSIKENEKWSKPKNLGKPINTKFDDKQITVPALGNKIYIVKECNKNGSHNDIYSATVPDDAEFLPNVSVIRGKVLDCQTLKPIEAKIFINNKTLGMKSYSTWSNASTGEYCLVIQAGAEYEIMIEKDNYAPYITQYDILDRIDENYIEKDCLLKQIQSLNKQASIAGENINDNSEIVIYPNPVDDKLNISLKSVRNFQNGRVIISDLNGIVVSEFEINNGENSNVSVDFSNLGTGVYFVRIIINDYSRIYKIVKN